MTNMNRETFEALKSAGVDEEKAARAAESVAVSESMLHTAIRDSKREILAAMNERFDKVDERFDKVDERFDKVDERFIRNESEISSLKDDISDIKVSVGRISGALWIISPVLIGLLAMMIPLVLSLGNIK